MAISKPCCPMYNSLGRSNKIELISSRLSNLHLQRISPSATTKHMLKHRVFSTRASLRSHVLAVGVVKRYTLSAKFSEGELIRIEGNIAVVKHIGYQLTTLVMFPSGAIAVVENYYFDGKLVPNISRASSHGKEATFNLIVDKEERLDPLLLNMVKTLLANENVDPNEQKPHCTACPHGKEYTITIRCNLKKCKDYRLVIDRWLDIVKQLAEIIKKTEGVTLEK